HRGSAGRRDRGDAQPWPRRAPRARDACSGRGRPWTRQVAGGGSCMTSGGCQCGAVRFRVDGELGRATICHCRMCQKAFGTFYGQLVSAKRTDLTWTRGAQKHFQSSNKVRRGSCGDCGTPMTYDPGRETVELAIGAFDDPTPIRPVLQLALEDAVPWAL